MSNLIVKNHDGVFYFRYRIPKNKTHLFPNNKLEYRTSLKTRCRRDAIKLARIVWVNMNIDDEKHNLIKPDKIKLNNQVEKRNPYTTGTFIPMAPSEEHEQLSLLRAISNKLDNQGQFRGINDPSDVERLAATRVNLDSSGEKTTISSGQDIQLSDALIEFLDEKKLHISNQKTLDMLKANCNLLIDVDGDLPTNQITDKVVIKFKKTLLRLPKRKSQSPKYRDLSVAQILELDIPESDKLSSTTINNISTKIISFLLWCKNNHYIDNDYSGVFKELMKTKKNKKVRATFTTEDIEKLFSSDEYQKTGFKGWSFRYWIPIIGLYTGARLNEISQLTVADVYTENDISVFSFNEHEENKKLKNENSARTVPVHKKLIELGFLEFVEYLTKLNETRLFPTLTKDKYGSYTRKISSFFNEKYKSCVGYISYVGIKKSSNLGKKDFHSFRHAFITQAKHLVLNERVVKEIVGHSSSDITFDTYGGDYTLKAKKKEIDKIKFDVKHPRKWERRFY